MKICPDFNWNLSGTVCPALTRLLIGGLSTGEKKPKKS